MADPLSAVGLAVQLAPVVVKYVIDVKHASRDRQALLAEVISTTGLLAMLKVALDQPDGADEWAKEMIKVDGIEEAVSGVLTILEEVNEKVGEPAKKSGRVKESLAWPFKSKDVEQMVNKLGRHKQRILIALQFQTFRSDSTIKGDLKSLKSDQTKVLANTVVMLEQSRQAKYETVMSWVSQFDYSKRHTAASSTRTPGTAEWILDTPSFKQWYEGTASILLCSGGPGVGKTITASFVIDHIKEQQMKSPFAASETGLAYIYLDYKQRSDLTTDTIVASLVKQLTVTESHFRIVEDLYSSRKDLKDNAPALQDMEKVLEDLVDEYEKVYLVIDAFDESNSTDTQEALAGLIASLQGTLGQIKVMVTTRARPSALTDLGETVFQELSASAGDIHTYVQHRMQTEKRLQRHTSDDESFRKNVTDTIIDRCKGMFLLARLHCDALARARTLADFEDCLKTLPSGVGGLRQTYFEAIERIRSQEKQDVDYAERILAWLCFSARPLKVQELRWALAVSPQKTDEVEFNEKRLLPREDLEPLCAGLIVIDENNEEVRLVHHTTQEFFNAEKNLLLADARQSIGLACIKFLTYKRFNRDCKTMEELRDLKQKNPFLQYAVEHFGRHSLDAGDGGVEQTVSLFRKAYSLNCLNEVRLNIANPQNVIVCSALTTAAEYNLVEVSKRLLEQEGNMPLCNFKINDLNVPGAAWRYAAHEAGYAGRPELLDILMSKGRVDLTRTDHIGNTLLHACSVGNCYNGLEAGLRMHKENINHKNANGNSPLHDAVAFGSEKCVRLLLDAGADPCISNNIRRSPIHEATAHHRGDLVQMLVPAYKSNYTFQDAFGISPLHACVTSGLAKEAETILQERPEVVHLRNEPGLTPLHDAAECGFPECAKVLVRYGADIHSLDGFGRTPLFCAVEKGKPLMVTYLLGLGADPSLDTHYKAIAHMTGRRDHDDIIKALLAHPKFDYRGVNTHDGQSGLHEACIAGKTQVALAFLERDVQEGGGLVRLKNAWGNTPVHDTALSGSVSIARRLVEIPSAVEMLSVENNDEETPLVLAEKLGRAEVLSLFKTALEKQKRKHADDEKTSSDAGACTQAAVADLFHQADLGTATAGSTAPQKAGQVAIV